MRLPFVTVLALVGGVALGGCGLPWVTGSPQGTTIPEAMQGLVNSRDKVSVALVCSSEVSLSVSTEIFKSKGFHVEEWRSSVCRDALANTEQWMLSRYGPQKNFSLIDRFATEKLLTEIKFSTATAISPEIRSALGDRLGATHACFVHETISEEDGAFYRKITEIREFRLIDLASGAVVAAESHRYTTRKLY